ncbi:hypothetical protein GGI20_000736 [Coemansia sp. BCRC 34301]|nr:hypothetical protein GGI20_000736 [Coemansia sp. BCRC 34301]
MEQPQQVEQPRQMAPQQIITAPAPQATKYKKWYIFLIVFCVLLILANLGLCGYYAYRAVEWRNNTYWSSSYYSNRSYYTTYYAWRAGVCGGVAFFAWVALIYYIVKYRRAAKSLNNPMPQMVPVVQWQQPYYPPPGTQWQQQQPQYSYQPAYGPPPPGQQPHPDFVYQQSPPPQQQMQQPQPVNASHV